MNPFIEETNGGYVIRFDANTGVWYWCGDTWVGQGRVAHSDPQVFDSKEAALSAVPVAIEYIYKWKPGWEAWLHEV
jgi:hypothetical protein